MSPESLLHTYQYCAKRLQLFLYNENVSFTIHDDDILTNFGGATERLRLDKLTS